MKKAILLSFALLSVATTLAPAETLLVPGGYPTIQQAIQASNNGDTVIVNPGTYLEHINFRGKNIVVTSTDPDDPEVVAATIIDGGGQGSVVKFENGETSEAVLTGFTITGGYGTAVAEIANYVFWGGGIFCNGSSPTTISVRSKCQEIIRNCGKYAMDQELVLLYPVQQSLTI
ncbi:MAG: hypothetical protein ACYS80_07190 [Planctomycetota bacterium]|jgi:hypothetical protein